MTTTEQAAGEPTIADAWHELTERWTVRELVAYAHRETDYCCQVGCGGGGCESCPCCCAGYCVSGLDGVPVPGTDLNPDDDEAHAAEVYRNWLEIAAEHNPVAAALGLSGAAAVVHFAGLLVEVRADLAPMALAKDVLGWLDDAVKAMDGAR